MGTQGRHGGDILCHVTVRKETGGAPWIGGWTFSSRNTSDDARDSTDSETQNIPPVLLPDRLASSRDKLKMSKDEGPDAVESERFDSHRLVSADSAPGVSQEVAELLVKRDEEWKKEVAKLLADMNKLKSSKDQTIRTLRHRVEEERERNKDLKQRISDMKAGKPESKKKHLDDSDDDPATASKEDVKAAENAYWQTSPDGADASCSQAKPRPTMASLTTTDKPLHEVRADDAKTIATLEQQLSSLRSIEEKLTSELQSLRSALASEQQRTRLVEQQRDEALEGAREAEVALGMAERKLQEQHQQIQKLRAEGESEGDWRIKGLVPASQLGEAQKLMGDQLSEISGLKTKVKSLKGSFEAQASRLKAAEKELAEKNEDLKRAKEAVTMAEAGNDRLLKEGSEMKDEVARMQAALEEVAALKTASEERERKKGDDFNDLHARFVEMERQKDEAVKEIEKVLGAVISQVQDEKDKVGGELVECRNKIEELGNQMSKLQETIRRLHAKIEDMGQDAQRKEAEIGALKQQLQAEEEEVVAKEKQLAKLTTDTQTLNVIMLKAVESKQGMEEHLQVKGREVEEIKGSLRQAQANVEALERELSWKDERLRVVEVNARMQQLELKKTEGRLQEVQQQLGMLQSERKTWMGQMEALALDLAEKNAENDELMHEMLMKTREVETLKASQRCGLESD